MKRKFILFFVGIFLFLTVIPAWAEDSENAKEEQAFTLQQAIDYALKISPLISINETKLEKGKVSLKEAQQAQHDAQKSNLGVFDALVARNGYYTRQAQMAITLAENGILQTTEAIKFSVESSYFNLANALEKLDIQKSAVEAAQDNLNIVTKKLDLGLSSQLELLTAQTNLVKEQVALKSAQRSVDYEYMNFNKTLGLPLDTKITLIDKLTAEDIGEVNIDQSVASALENRMEIITAKEQNEVAQLYLEVVDKMYTPNTYKYQEAKYDAETAAYSVDKTRQDVELSVHKAYADMVDAFESLDVLDKTIEQLQKVYDVTKTKYDAGLATDYEVIEASNNVSETKLQKAQALLGYNLAKKQFEVSSGIGLPSGN